MWHQGLLNFTGCSDPECSKHSLPDRRIDLELKYTDKRNDIALSVQVRSQAKLTVQAITKDLLRFLLLDDIHPKHVRLVQLKNNKTSRPLHAVDASETLQELNVVNNGVLYFEPTPNAPPPKLCRLTIIGPDKETNKIFEWYRAKTTLQMLFDFVVEQFSLRDIEPHRIHLLSIVEELEWFRAPTARLAELELHDRMNIQVEITPPPRSTAIGQKKLVHVQCACQDNSFVLDLPTTETIGGLKTKIEKRFQGLRVTEFQMYNEKQEVLSLITDARDLASFDIKPDQTVHVKCLLTRIKERPTAAAAINEAETIDSSATTSKKPLEITVVCKFPSKEKRTLQVSVRDTLPQLVTKLKDLVKDKPLVLSKMCTKSREISFAQKQDSAQCLTDLGLKPTEKIYAMFVNKTRSSASIVEEPMSFSSESDSDGQPGGDNGTPIGLANLGNSCYMSSALQCLAHVPPLTEFFLKGFQRSRTTNGENRSDDWSPFDRIGKLTSAYAELLRCLWHQEKGSKKRSSFAPTQIKTIAGKMEPHFATTEQQDSHEFMTFLLDRMHEELEKARSNHRSTIIRDTFFGEIRSTITCTSCHKAKASEQPFNFLSIPLDQRERRFVVKYILTSGQSEYTRVYVPIDGTVAHIVYEFAEQMQQPQLFYHMLPMLPEYELDFSTPISYLAQSEIILIEQEELLTKALPARPTSARSRISTLESCLKQFFSMEMLQDRWVCQQPTCRRQTMATKRLEICKLPSVLIIQLKRFYHDQGLHQKIDTFVKYPIEQLNMSEFVSEAERETVYDLIATSNHIGSISGGHYTAFAKRPTSTNDEWFKFDDAYVTRVEFDDVKRKIVSRHAYLLFYMRRDVLKTT